MKVFVEYLAVVSREFEVDDKFAELAQEEYNNELVEELYQQAQDMIPYEVRAVRDKNGNILVEA